MDRKKIKLDDAYFGVNLYSLNYSSLEKRKIETYNLFNFGRVKWSVARYVSMTKDERRGLLSDPLHFCFGDVQGRCEYEFVVCPWGGLDENNRVVDVGEKVDVFKMYVEPNANYLMGLVNSISVNSAKQYLREERKSRRG